MSRGPSPVIPLILVGVLGLFLWGPYLKEGSLRDSIDDVQEIVVATLSPLLVLLIVTLSIALFMNEIVAIPLLFMLVFLLFNFVSFAPILLLLVIHFFSKNHNGSWSPSCMDHASYYTTGDDGEGGFGWGWFLLVVIFLMLSYFFFEGEEYGWWISLIVVAPVVFYFSMVDH